MQPILRLYVQNKRLNTTFLSISSSACRRIINTSLAIPVQFFLDFPVLERTRCYRVMIDRLGLCLDERLLNLIRFSARVSRWQTFKLFMMDSSISWAGFIYKLDCFFYAIKAALVFYCRLVAAFI